MEKGERPNQTQDLTEGERVQPYALTPAENQYYLWRDKE